MKKLLGLMLLLPLAGCDDRDLEAMRRVGDKAMDKAAGLARQAQTKVNLPTPETPPAAAIAAKEPSAAEKTLKRLKWDRELAGAAIEAKDEPEGLALKGTVPSEALRRRALELAESTVGVAKVIDRLTVGTP